METTTIIKAELGVFIKSLARHQKLAWNEPQDGQRQHQIATSVDPADEVVTNVRKRFWAVHNETPVRERPAFDDFVRMFYSQHAKIRLAMRSAPDLAVPEATGGYIVLAGELLALHSVVRGQGDWLLGNAIGDGAVSLCTHAVPHLLALYSGRGFREVKREPDRIAGRPDVVWMRRDAS